MSTSKLSKLSMASHHYRKIGNNVPHFSDFLYLKIMIRKNNVPHFSDFLHLKIMIRISYKYKQIKVPNLVYFGSQSITSYNDYSTIFINLQI